MQENARQGYWNGSVPPFGYRAVTTDTVGNRGRHKRRLEIDPVGAETVLAGQDGQVMGMKAIASQLNRQGLSMRGRPQPDWIAVSVPAIIDAGTFARVAKRREQERALSIDETLRTQTVKARRSEVLTEMAKLKDR